MNYISLYITFLMLLYVIFIMFLLYEILKSKALYASQTMARPKVEK
jgi:hypothetical protein